MDSIDIWNWWIKYQNKVREDALNQCIKKSKGVYNKDIHDFVRHHLGLFPGEKYEETFKVVGLKHKKDEKQKQK